MGVQISTIESADGTKHVDIVLETPGDIFGCSGEGYPIGTIAHTDDLKVCYVWTGKLWELC